MYADKWAEGLEKKYDHHICTSLGSSSGSIDSSGNSIGCVLRVSDFVYSFLAKASHQCS